MEVYSGDKNPRGGIRVLGKIDDKYTAIVFYVNKHTEQAEDSEDDEYPEWLDYDEETGIWYWKEGWYEELEQFASVYDLIWVPRNVTKWIEIPEF